LKIFLLLLLILFLIKKSIIDEFDTVEITENKKGKDFIREHSFREKNIFLLKEDVQDSHDKNVLNSNYIRIR
jgi:hypothetical protein